MTKFLLIFFLVLFSCSKDNEACADSELDLNCGNVIYPKQKKSPYVLPWGIGKTYNVSQGNCSDRSHSEGSYNQFGYYFNMQIGNEIVAIRSGVVIALEESNTDNEKGSKDALKNNYIQIEHEDGTTASYMHLTFNGVLKNLEGNVYQEERIALSGNTGWSTGPHLHLQVNELFDYKYVGILITFKNTKPHC